MYICLFVSFILFFFKYFSYLLFYTLDICTFSRFKETASSSLKERKTKRNMAENSQHTFRLLTSYSYVYICMCVYVCGFLWLSIFDVLISWLHVLYYLSLRKKKYIILYECVFYSF